MITVLAPSPSIDVTYAVDTLRPGATHRPRSAHRRAGGKAVNAARAAARLGADVVVVCPLPPDAVALFEDDLGGDGATLRVVETAAPVRMCVSIADLADEAMTEVYEHAPSLDDGAFAGLLDGAAGDGWVAVSGSAPGRGAELAPALASRSTPPRIAVDTHGPALRAALAVRPALLKVNRAEAAEATGVPPDAELVALLDALQQQTAGVVVVTDGPAGVIGGDGSDRWRLGLPGVRGPYSQGSGDSLLGGLLAAYDGGAGTLDALRLGIGAATANALVPEAGQFDVDLARRFADEVHVTD